MIRVIRAKLHGIRVTGADLNYHGSITLDPDHCRDVGIYPLEFVEVWNKATAARLTTYVIFGEAGSRCCILNGAAARTCHPGDELIIAASDYIHPGDLAAMKPRILTFLPDNAVDERLGYRVEAAGDYYDFHIDKI
jgi:aspartate 1-decarboxylase